MKGRHLVVVLGTVLVAGVLFGISAQQKARDVRLPLDKHRVLGTPKTFQNLTLIPVYAPGAKATNTFMTLDEGLKAKVVKVREGQGGGSVNTLYITNLGKKTALYYGGRGRAGRSAGSLPRNGYHHPAGRKRGPGHGVLCRTWPMERRSGL